MVRFLKFLGLANAKQVLKYTWPSEILHRLRANTLLDLACKPPTGQKGSSGPEECSVDEGSVVESCGLVEEGAVEEKSRLENGGLPSPTHSSCQISMPAKVSKQALAQRGEIGKIYEKSGTLQKHVRFTGFVMRIDLKALW